MDTELAQAIDIIVKHADPEKIILFGSRSNDTHNLESDYDLLIVKDTSLENNLLLKKIRRELIGVCASFDLIIETNSRLDKLKNIKWYIYNEALNGDTIYERTNS